MSDIVKPLRQGRVYVLGAIDTIPESAEMPGHDGYLYVIEFTNRTLKVGISCHPRRRVRQHDHAFQPVGIRVARVWLSVPHSNYAANEQSLLAFGPKANATKIRNEYFTGGSFEEFVRAAEALRFTPLDRDAATAKTEAQTAALRAVLRSRADRVSVSRLYVDEAEKWMALVNGVTPDGTERTRVGRLLDSDGSGVDAYVELAGSFEESMGLTADDVLQMNYIDLIELLLEAKVRTAMNQFRSFAIENDRDDLLESTWEHIQRIEGTA